MERRVEGRDRRMFPGLAWPRGGSDNGQITIEMMTETKPWPLAVWREQPARLGRGGWRGRGESKNNFSA